jgi:hypothetical protein
MIQAPEGFSLTRKYQTSLKKSMADFVAAKTKKLTNLGTFELSSRHLGKSVVVSVQSGNRTRSGVNLIKPFFCQRRRSHKAAAFVPSQAFPT